MALVAKTPPANAEDTRIVGSVSGLRTPLGVGNLCILAWKIPWIGETAGLQSMELQRVGHD